MAKKDKAWEIELEFDEAFEWRLEQLKQAGFPHFPAFRLAVTDGLDYRKPIHMLEKGATVEQVLEMYLDNY
jgi:hypothetical protein